MHQLDKSVDNLWVHSDSTPFFPHRTMNRTQLPNTTSRLCDNTAWASAKVALDDFISDIIHSVYFSALADTIYWLKEHLINLPWLQSPLTDTLKALLTPTVVNLQQQTDLQIAIECPPTMIQLNQDLPLSIPAPSCIQASTSFPKTRRLR